MKFLRVEFKAGFDFINLESTTSISFNSDNQFTIDTVDGNRVHYNLKPENSVNLPQRFTEFLGKFNRADIDTVFPIIVEGFDDGQD